MCLNKKITNRVRVIQIKSDIALFQMLLSCQPGSILRHHRHASNTQAVLKGRWATFQKATLNSPHRRQYHNVM